MMNNQTHPLGIIFDFDGTLIDSESYHEALYCEAAADLGYQLSNHEYRSRLRGKTDEEIFRFIANFIEDPQRIEEKLEWKQRKFQNLLLHGRIPSVPGAVTFIRSAHMQKIPLALGTSAVYAEAEIGLRGLGVFDFFKRIVSAESVEWGKPAPDIYLKAATLLKIDPKDCLVYEDSLQGVLAATAAGMPVIGIEAVEPERLLEAGALTVIPDFQHHQIPAVRAA
jgi:HAD superfamily hydrolase (TIGR01509 family)